MNDKINDEKSVSLVIDIASTGVSCAIYDSLMRVPLLVPFEKEGLDYIPSVVHIPDNEIDTCTFGIQALNSIKHDQSGLLYNLEELLNTDNDYIVIEDRPPYSIQKIVSNLFKYIKEEVEEKQLNNSTIENCVIITNGEQKYIKLLRKAAQINQFKEIEVIPREEAIINFWNYSHTIYDYNDTNKILCLEIAYSSLKIRLINKNEEEEFTPTENDISSTIDFGMINLSKIVWDNLLEQNLIDTENYLSLETNAEKLQATIDALDEMIFDSEECIFFGKKVAIPRITLSKCKKIFDQQLRDLLSVALQEENLQYDANTTSLILFGIGALKEHVKNTVIECYPGPINIQTNSSFAPVFGGAYVGDSPAKIRQIDPNSAIELKPGSQLGLYTILRKVGSGGMGDVWIAHHRTLDQKVAIKVLHTKLTQSSESVDRFLAEIRNTAKLQHPNIVRAHDAGYLNGIYYLVSDFIRGSELSEMMENNGGALPELDVLQIALDIANALKYAWEKYKILHRDIKPDNIMLDYEESKAMLMDMGISKSLLENKSGLTTENTMLGTPHYMCPEQISGDKADCRSDIYSLGATLFHCLTGSKPYNADSIVNIAMKHLTEPIPSILDYDSTLSPKVDQMLRKMMAKKPENRQEDWQEVIDELEKIIYTKTVSEEWLNEEKRSRQNDLIVKLITVAAATMSVLLAIFVIFGSQEAQKQVKITYGKVVDIALRIKPEKATITLINKRPNIKCKVKDSKVSRHILTDVKTGKYTAIIKADGFKTLTKNVIVGDENNTFVYELEPLVGSVTIQTNPGANLQVIDRNGKVKDIGTSDKTGEFWLNLNEGSYQLRISKPLYETETVALNISSDKKPVLTRILKLKAGNIIFKNDLSCDIILDKQLIGKTNEVVQHIPTGKHTVTIRRDGYVDQTIDINITDYANEPISVPGLRPQVGKFTIALAPPSEHIQEKFLPEEASIRVNKGEWFRVSLPYTSNLKRAGLISVEVTMDDFDVINPTQNIKIENEKIKEVQIQYQTKEASIFIENSEPLPIYCDGELVGKTGKMVHVKSYITHTIEVKKDGYRTYQFEVILEPKQLKSLKLPKLVSIKSSLTITIKPKKEFMSIVSKSPKKVSIKIDKDGAWFMTDLPFSIEKIQCMKHEVRLKAKHFVIYPPIQTVNVLENKVNEVSFTWAPEEVPFTINANVPGAKIYIDNKLVGSVGHEFMITPYFNHNVLIKAPDHVKLAFNLAIKKREQYKKEITVHLKRLKGIIIGKDFKPSLSGLTMIYLKPDKFIMGSKKGLNTEKPPHRISLEHGFWMSDTEITQLQFIEVMKYNPSLFNDHQKPVERVSWEEAMTFCKKLTEKQRELGILNPNDYFTLPTEAEWEYACKAGSTTQFNVGNNLTSDDANFDGNYSFLGNCTGIFRKHTTKVKTFKPNQFNLYDMHGNVAEWCLDGYIFSYAETNNKDPFRNPNGINKVVRGGSWKSYPKYCRSSARSNKQLRSKSPTLGFRIVLKIVE
jgi:serine/threonine protein kinase/formylglycine-generating enzyme required for sulfatase activity